MKVEISAQVLAIKAAKKALKKQGDIKLVELVEIVAKKLLKKTATTSDEQIEAWLLESSKFTKEQHIIKLNQKDTKKSSNKRVAALEARDEKPCKKIKTEAVLWREEQHMKVTPPSPTAADIAPLTTFDDCRGIVDDTVINFCIGPKKFTRPSPIQAQTWPILLQGHDIISIAETGSGKTLGFSLPFLQRMSAIKKHKLPRMLVLAPTRELAMQSNVVAEELGGVVGLTSVVIYGGVPKHEQIRQLKQGVDICIGTPGRVKDLIQEGALKLHQVEYLVLDEADRMLDLGFEPEVRAIVAECPTKRQTAMFSATWPQRIQSIAMEFMKSPYKVSVGMNAENEDSLTANKRVAQVIEVMEDRERLPRLQSLLKQVHRNGNRVLVFALYKKEVERLEQSLQRSGWKCSSIHGNKQQGARTQALEEFKSGQCPLLIATDVAARGLDVPMVEVVINFTFPLTIEDYVHRIGRTGRAGKSGVAYTFFQPTDKARAGELQLVLRESDQPIPEDLKRFGSTIKKKEHSMYGNFGPRSDGTEMKKATKIVFN